MKMKVTLAIACLLSCSSAIQLKQEKQGPWEYDPSKTPWDKDSLPDCPKDPNSTLMEDCKTHVSKYPNVGATCKSQVKSDSSLL